MANIVLIGMPACGKSTVGVILAKTLGIDFVDTDLIIQKREGMLLQQIIDSRGIDEFLECERRAVMSLECDNCVVATGGSVIFKEDAIAHLKENGKIFYLNVPLDEIKMRLSNIKTRGVAAAHGESIEDIYNCRKPLYERLCDVNLDLTGCSAEDTVSKICEILGK